ncbi:hypothetical protein L1987_13911 [Smallanthus sonchifolius]|uniref:Uncharacterized protein n=1 Tax=Smallanthus sonchifolius TaxID=185202 RepID=A0ACB9JKJ2_9ASTR|nr:hypothetical protein L1987_13911 [Smallanthus sonchifolius]
MPRRRVRKFRRWSVIGEEEVASSGEVGVLDEKADMRLAKEVVQDVFLTSLKRATSVQSGVGSKGVASGRVHEEGGLQETSRRHSSNSRRSMSLSPTRNGKGIHG